MSDVVALTYDTLPPLSHLRREIDEHGNVRISVAAGEPGALARRAAMHGTAWISIVWSTLITASLAALLFPMFLANRPQPRWLYEILMIAAGVFFSAMFLLVWWLEFRKRMDDIERASLQMTVVSASPRELLVESVGPFGRISKSLAPSGDLYCKRMPGARIECLHVEALDGEITLLFPGLSTRELRWIAAEIVRATRAA
ncbi:MAG: hypothetical protein H7Z14_02340 [Anaerolineae bacterium]|nr:hypothetical protein [Phycisphaerae bacterium]